MQLKTAFFQRSALDVAPDLLGCYLIFKGRKVRIVETEAYCGENDLACHAAKGKTERTKVLYQKAGTAYVYLVYGMHYLLNVVCDRVDSPHAVLFRAAEEEGQSHSLLAGPGRLTKQLGIDLRWNSTLFGENELEIHRGSAPKTILRGPRIGVNYAGEWALKPWRFGDASSPSLSRPF